MDDKKESLMVTFERARIMSQLLHKEKKSIIRRMKNRTQMPDDESRFKEVEKLIEELRQIAYKTKTTDQKLTWGG